MYICTKAVATSTCWRGDLVGCRVDLDTVQREVAVWMQGIETSHWCQHHLHYCWDCHILSGETTLVKLLVVLSVMWTQSSTVRVFSSLHVLPHLLLTSSMEQSPSWEANRSSASHKIPGILWAWSFFTAFKRACHLSLFWARSIQSMPSHTTSLRSILIVSSNLYLSLPSGFLPSGFSTKTWCTPLLSLIHATCPALLFLHFITWIVFGKKYRS